MEDDLAGGGDRLVFGRSLGAIDLLERKDGLDGLAHRLRYGLDRGDFGIVLIGNRISEASRVGRGLGLREDGIAGSGGRMGGFRGCFLGLGFGSVAVCLGIVLSWE